MTSIEQIQISGIRSFNPNPAHRQSILFYKPLTVILGKNGAGKTTIIEALLNACTGQMPPGSGAEKSSFIYDPKVMGEADVKAQIRLLFTGRGGKVMQVIRSFQATRTRSKTTFATLDNTVAFQDTATGKVVSSTYRANDVDRAVPEMLGVSPAVLEHVIFCHQEDCNWPLAPPKDVKRIFDDIFAATRYVLALDRLRENGKEFRRQQKEHEAHLMALREHREQAQQLAADISTKEEAVRGLRQRVAASEPELRQLESAAAALAASEQAAERLAREAAVLHGRVEEKRESVRRANLPPTRQTLEELLELRDGFAAHMQRLEASSAPLAARLAAAEAAARGAEDAALELRARIGFMAQHEDAYRRGCAELREALLALGGPVAAALPSGPSDSPDHAPALGEDALRRVWAAAEASVLAAANAREEAMRAATGAAQSAHDARAETQRAMDADAREASLAAQQCARERRRAEAAAAALARLGDPVGDAALDAARAALAEGDGPETGGLRARRALAERRVARGRAALARRARRAGADAAIGLLRAQLEARRGDCAGRRALLAAGGEARAARDLSAAAEAAANAAEKAAAADRRGAVLHAARAAQCAQWERDEGEWRRRYLALAAAMQRPAEAAEAALGDFGADLCADYVAALAAARGAVQSARRRRDVLDAAAACHADYAALSRESNGCPVCARPFATSAEVDGFVARCEAQQRAASPAAVSAATSEVEAAEETLRRLDRAAADAAAVERLAAELPSLRAAVRATEADLADAVAQLEEANADRERCQAAWRAAQCVSQSVAEAIAAESDVAVLERQLACRMAEAAADAEAEDGEGRHLSDSDTDDDEADGATLSAGYDAACAELARVSAALDALHGGAALAERRQALLDLEVRRARQAELAQTYKAACAEAEESQQRVAAMDARRVAAETRLAEESAVLAERQRALAAADASSQSRLDAAHEARRVVSAMCPRLLDGAAQCAASPLRAAREQLEAAEAAGRARAAEAAALRAEADAARRVVAEQSGHAAAMARHIEVLQTARAIAADEARLAEVEAALAALKSTDAADGGAVALLGRDVVQRETVPRLREMLRQRVGEIERGRAQQEGAIEAMLQDVAGIRNQLLKDKYQDVEKRYRSTFLKVQTTEIAVADIDKYYRALEKAVQSYHQEKIAQINQILADLWRQTYKGSDIDTIELRSEDDVATSTAARRSYSYRVVMKRGNSEMDMRGRCSAGQKVLASVLIRLALSEAFCCDCGILALDEPTTNLDEDNARSLAESLRLLIDNRRGVKHFQLIVITHDEQFVRALGGQSLETFYYIHKDREGAFSVIEERTFEQLFAA